jgi:hypothetical protein
MRAVLVKPERAPEVVEIENSLEALQAAVGGYIETVSMPCGLVLVCNEEGKIRGLPFNRYFGNDYIAGNFVVVGTDGEGEFESLSEEQVLVVKELF